MEGKLPLISIITVVRNGASHIEQCMNSVLEQSYPHIEYIVIDGGSTDGTQQKIKRYEHALKAFISEPDHGIADAFNKGIRLAKGDVIGLINADDWLEPGAAFRIAEESLNCDILYGNLRQWHANGTQYVIRANHKKLEKGMSVNHPAVFVSRSVYEKIGLYNITYRLAMDYELLLRCYKAGFRFHYSNEVFTNMKTDGASDKNWLKALKEVKRARDEQSGKSFGNTLSFMQACGRTYVSKLLLNSVFEPLFSIYRKRTKNTVKHVS